MQLTETARVRLLIDGKEAVSELSIMENKYQELLTKQKEFSKSSKEWRDIQREIKETAKTVDVLRERVDLSQMTFKELDRYARDLARTMKNELVPGTEEYSRASVKLKDVNTRLQDIRGDLRATHNEVQKGEGTWSKMKSWVVGAFAVTAVLEFGRRIVDFGKQVFEITSKFETYDTVLRNTLGGQKEAVAAMDMIKDIAASTPVSVDEMTSSFIKMVNRGLKPTSVEIKQLADLASSQGKSFDQLTEAVLDAMMGEGERLKEFGIRMRKNGDDISLSFKGQTVEVKNNEAAIFDAIVAMGAYEGVAGMTSEISKTLEGRVSNLGDAWDFVSVAIGERLRPIFVAILDLFVRGVNFVSSFIDNIEPLVIVFNVLRESNQRLWSMMSDLFFQVFPRAQGLTFDMGKAIKVLATVFMALQTPILIVRGVVIALIDSFSVLLNGAKGIGALLTGDFVAASKAAVGFGQSVVALKKNAVQNFGAIRKGFEDIWSSETKKIANSSSAWDQYVSGLKDGQESVTETASGETEKRQKAQDKALSKSLKAEEKALAEQLKVTAETIKKIDAAWIESEENEVDRNKKKLMAKFEDELSALEKKQVSAEKYAELEKQLKENLVRDLEKIDQDSLDKQQKAREKWSDAIQKEIEKVQQNIPALHERAAVKVEAIEKRLGNQIIAFHKEVEKNRDAALIKEQEQQVVREQLLQQGFRLAGVILNEIEGNIDRQLALATTATEKAVLLNKKAWLGVADSAINALSQLAQGNVVGAIVGGLGALFGALNNWVNKSANLMQARLEDLRRELEAAGKQFLEFANSFGDAIDPAKIEAAYEGLFKISQIQPVRLDFGEYDSYERRIQQEMDIANSINKNYDTAVKREDDYSKQVISNINAAYDAELNRINEKYDLLDQLANQQFTAETLQIRELQGQQLLELVANEEEKTSILTEYATKRNEILSAFSLADQAITDETDKATLDAINAARDARTTALIELQGKLNTELEYIINSEDGKRRELSATEKIAKEATESLDTLRLEKQAADILREKEKNTELVAAEQTKNTLLETEAARYNGVLTALGLAKDAALAESFTILKDLINKGYDEMMQKALDAFNAGKLTAEQYNEIAAKLFQIQGQINTIDWSKVTIPNFDFTNFTVPRFEKGTFQPMRDTTYFEGAGTLGGLRHATPEGGNWVINPRNGKLLATVENGEFMGVFSREVTRQHGGLLSQLANSSLARSGTPIVAEKGFFGKSFESGRMNTISAQDGLSAELLKENNRLLSELTMIMLGVAESSDRAAKKELILSVNRLQDASNAVYEIDRRSDFR